MKIALISGSPKVNNSVSGALLKDLKSHLAKKAEIIEIGFHKTILSEEVLEELKDADTLVFSCPLYVDGIPSHLLSCLIQLEKVSWQNPNIHTYGIVNCGFYEGIQAKFALKLFENWCARSGCIFGGGVGIGGGGALNAAPTVKNGHGPKAPIDKALKILADNIIQQRTQENHYVSVAFPRFLYRMAGQMGWRQMIKENGGKAKDLGKRPDLL